VGGLLLFGSGTGLFSYVLEVFGEHTLSGYDILGILIVSALLLAGYGFRAARTEFPLLRLILFRVRTFWASASGSFFAQLGIGGIPFLFPLLYQVGVGFIPIQSGMLMMPQAIAAMSLKLTMPKILARVGYRGVLISNTFILGLLIILFATIGTGTPLWLIVMQAFCFGFFTSVQYTSMNTLVYADISPDATSSASNIDMARSDVTMFIFSLPVYWAIILAAPDISRNVRPLVVGTLVISAAEIALLLGYVEITALSAPSQLTGAGRLSEWFRQAIFWVVVNVLPYAVPFIVALSLHRRLRREMFPEGMSP
jgi:hypothetical protein